MAECYGRPRPADERPSLLQTPGRMIPNIRPSPRKITLGRSMSYDVTFEAANGGHHLLLLLGRDLELVQGLGQVRG